MKMLIEIIYFGYGILIYAFAINWLSKYLGMKSWYDLFGKISFRDLSWVNILWLLVAYPLLLGIGIYILNIFKLRLVK